ncbi:MAG: addiction module toxin RelE [Deltaproteobacteria bacterium RBG_13_43_22]|nr:MAG: addiction module toxin RelE [Deltaproteobacteria bacterium RBG_13_43_22]
MARPLRIEFPGAVYHITSRGNDRKEIFEDDLDRKAFLEILYRVCTRYHWLCHAFCLMDNHYHLLIETPEGNLSIGMRQLNGVYTQAFNRVHGRVGHLFQGRFKGIVVQKDSHLLEASRYIVINPIRAKLVKNPNQWIWSSYSATAGQGSSPPFLTVDWVLGQLASERKIAERIYREFVRAGIRAESIWKDLRGQSILGEDDFVVGMRSHIAGKEHIPEISKRQRFINRPILTKIFTTEVLQSKEARDERIIEAVERYGYSQKQIADHLGLHFASISRIIRKKETMLRI